MFKLEQEPWIKADLEGGGQVEPLFTWRDGAGLVVHLSQTTPGSDHYSFFLGSENINSERTAPEPAVVHKPMTSIPVEILIDAATRYPGDDGI